MQAFIQYDGEPNVGIFGGCFTLDIPDLNTCAEDREKFRKELTHLYSEYIDDKVYVHFSDECPNCLKIGITQCSECCGY